MVSVLSTGKYRSKVERARHLGFEVRLLFFTLRSVAMNVERVRLRVAKGGHDVPEDRIRQRRVRFFAQLPWFMSRVDFALIYDNSESSLALIGRKRGPFIELSNDAPDEVRRAMEATIALS